jgi:CHAD domain-containing protein
MADDTNFEREAKFDVDVMFELPDFRGVVGQTVRLAEQRLWAVYYDTADLRLWRRGITFRHRTGEGDVGVWTMKLPSDGTGLTVDRTELTWGSPGDQLPDEAARYLRGVVRRASLRPVAELATIRRRLELRGSNGEVYGEIDDDTVTVLSGDRDSFRFRQLEFELDQCPPKTVRAIVKTLRKSGARPSTDSKLGIALADSDADTRSRPVPGITRRSTVGELVQWSTSRALNQLLDHDYGLRVESTQPPVRDIHQARVATRRLRADLKLLEPALDPIWVRHTRTELKWIAGLLGVIRDLDVLAEALDPDDSGSLPESDGVRQLQGRIEDQRREASGDLIKAMVGERYLNLLDRLAAAAAAPPLAGSVSAGASRSSRRLADSPAARELPKMVGRRWRGLRRKIDRGGGHPSDGQLHRIRIAAKQLRYASEMAVPVIGKPAKRTAKAAERLQAVLGDHHDAVNAEQWLRREALSSSAEASFAAGRLVAGQEDIQQRLRHRWRGPSKRLGEKNVRSWLN